MRIVPALIATAIAAAATVGHAAPRLSPEDAIAKALDGRVAGKPTDCLIQHNIRSTQIIDGTAILYEMNNGVLYLNRPTSGASSLRRGLALITDTHSSQLCSIDIVRLYDTASRFETGSVGLGPFVPYPRPPKGTR